MERFRHALESSPDRTLTRSTANAVRKIQVTSTSSYVPGNRAREIVEPGSDDLDTEGAVPLDLKSPSRSPEINLRIRPERTDTLRRPPGRAKILLSRLRRTP